MKDKYATAEHRLPPVEDILTPQYLIPLATYFLLFRLASRYVKKNLWLEYSGFKQYRLQNISICFLHSCISGIWSLCFALKHGKEMTENVLGYYSSLAAQLPLLSVAYFIQDALDMISYEWSKWTCELLLHHIATCVALMSGLLPHKFLLCDYWALLMEVNSIFLHMRTMMQITGQSKQTPGIFKTIVWSNVSTFVIFRFGAQAYFVSWALSNAHRYHYFYSIIALGGPLVFLVINVLLFVRILASDELLREISWKPANRDQESRQKEDNIPLRKKDEALSR